MYQTQDFSRLLGTPGFSDALLKNHFTLYEGYVKNTNALMERLQTKESGLEYAELKRRFGWEWNGMRLHELYFGNMTKAGTALAAGSLQEKIIAQFGSVEAWQKDFVATGTMRGIGWTALATDPESGRIFNVWVNEHDGGHLAGAAPLLVMDVFEHAFVLDYGLKRAEYIEAFLKAIDWDTVASRLR